jgi:hypothetical protein
LPRRFNASLLSQDKQQKLFFWKIKLKVDLNELIVAPNSQAIQMSYFKQIHKNQYLVSLSIQDLIAQRRILKAKMKYFQNLYDEGELAEEENQDDYGMLATIQAEMSYAEHCMLRCERKLKLVDRLIISKSIQLWKTKN